MTFLPIFPPQKGQKSPRLREYRRRGLRRTVAYEEGFRKVPLCSLCAVLLAGDGVEHQHADAQNHTDDGGNDLRSDEQQSRDKQGDALKGLEVALEVASDSDCKEEGAQQHLGCADDDLNDSAFQQDSGIVNEDKGNKEADRQRNSYINFLPSLLAKWNVNDDFKVRGSFTQTLSRPKYSALVPSVNIKRSDNEITIGNPELKPTVSYNFDLSADYYFRSIGLISAGIFYKKIDDFIVDQVSTNYEYQGNTYTRFTQPKNAGNANLVGVELSYQRDFSFIAPALKCVGFYGTYTYTHSRVEDFNFEGRENEKDLSMPGSPEHTANASLYFEKGGLNLRLSYNFASDFIDEMGESTFYDRYYDKVNYMDVNASYTFGKKFKTTFYAEANNLLNQPLRYYQGTKDRTMQAEYYGVKVNAGVKINF